MSAPIERAQTGCVEGNAEKPLSAVQKAMDRIPEDFRMTQMNQCFMNEARKRGEKDPVGAFITHCHMLIESVGVALIPTHTEDGLPFAYTIGLEAKFNHPELIVMGLGFDLAGPILNSIVFDMIANKNQMLENKQMISPTNLKSTPIKCDLRVHEPTTDSTVRKHMSRCTLYYSVFEQKDQAGKPRDFRIRQILWPSAAGEWPSAGTVDDQPVF